MTLHEIFKLLKEKDKRTFSSLKASAQQQTKKTIIYWVTKDPSDICRLATFNDFIMADDWEFDKKRKKK